MLKRIDVVKNRINTSKDGRTLVSNFGYLMLLQVASYIFPVITLPYLADVIGVEGFGKIAFASAIMVWFQTIADWGFTFTATRDVAKNRDDKEKVSEIFSNVLWARFLLAIVSFLLLLGCILCIQEFRDSADVILVTFLMIPGHIMFPDWFFQAMERMKYITIFNFLMKILFTVAVFIFIKEKDDYIIQPLLTSVGYVFCGLVAMYLIIVKWGIRLRFSSLMKVVNTIKSSTDVFINNLFPTLYNAFSTVMLGFVGGSAANGMLDAGSKFVNIVQSFIHILSRTFFPFLSRRIDKHYVFARINIGVSIIATIVLFFGSPQIIALFFTEEFSDAILVLQIMSISIVFLAISNVYGTNYLIVTNHERELRKLTTWVSICGFFMALILVYNLSYIGAAITITASRGMLGLGSVILAKKIQNKTI